MKLVCLVNVTPKVKILQDLRKDTPEQAYPLGGHLVIVVKRLEQVGDGD